MMNTGFYGFLLVCALFILLCVLHRLHKAHSQVKAIKNAYPRYLGNVVYTHATYEIGDMFEGVFYVLHFSYTDDETHETKETAMWLPNEVSVADGLNIEVYTSEDGKKAVASGIRNRLVKDFMQYLVVLGSNILAIVYLVCRLIIAR